MIMKLKDQVCSLESAKRLKELGIEQDSIFCYFHCSDDSFELDYNTWKKTEIFPHEYISAFTVAELGEFLPPELDGLYFTSFRCARNGWWCEYSDGNGASMRSFWSKNEAECRATLLINLMVKPQ